MVIYKRFQKYKITNGKILIKTKDKIIYEW